MSGQSTFPLDLALLGFLMQGSAHGYALHERADEELGRIWYMGISNVYGTLKQLEEAGHVEVALDEEGYPPRKVYSITQGGRERFLTWVRAPVPAIRDMRVEFLAKLYFFRTLRLDDLDALVEEQKRVCERRLEELAQDGGETPDDFDCAVREFRRLRVKASLDWLCAVRKDWA